MSQFQPALTFSPDTFGGVFQREGQTQVAGICYYYKLLMIQCGVVGPVALQISPEPS